MSFELSRLFFPRLVYNDCFGPLEHLCRLLLHFLQRELHFSMCQLTEVVQHLLIKELSLFERKVF